jgi:Rieske Fe-S protein
MPKCDVCGNDYDKTFQITQAGRTLTFDSFECAIHAMAPSCAHCGCRIIGHGAEHDGKIYCGADCAKNSGVAGMRDRA